MSVPDTQAGHWWQIPLVLGLLGVITMGGGAIAHVSDEATAVQTAADTTVPANASSTEATTGATAAPTTTSTSTSTTTTVPLPPSDQRTLEPLEVIGGDIAPKSVVHSGNGYFIANNMMYRHTMTLYDRDMNLVATIPDTVDLGEFGFEYEGEYQGAPVEAAFTSDGAYAYVSNYQMYGPGFENPGDDGCSDGDWDQSFLYRVDVAEAEIDQVIQVGAVPKFVAVTPDDRTVLVTNWCTYDLSVVDTETGSEVRRIDIGRFPRGIAVTQDGSKAYIAVMGSTDIAVVSLDDYSVSWINGVGGSPRHVVLSPDDAYLYVTLNRDGRIAKVDTATGQVVATVATGAAPRSMTIAEDGRSLYVVNYNDNTVSKVTTDDMTEVQELDVGYHPIGITFDAAEGNVWVANYGGSINVLADR